MFETSKLSRNLWLRDTQRRMRYAEWLNLEVAKGIYKKEKILL